jgi:hypothetical protein
MLLRRENMRLERRLAEQGERLGAVENVKEELRKAHQEYLFAALAGSSHINPRVLKMFNLEEGRVDYTFNLMNELTKSGNENDMWRETALKYMVRSTLQEKGLGEVSAFAYYGGKVYGTTGLEKSCRSMCGFEKFLGENEKFVEALGSGKRIRVTYENKDIVFLPKDKRDVVRVAYMVPKAKPGKLLTLVRNGRVAAHSIAEMFKEVKYSVGEPNTI